MTQKGKSDSRQGKGPHRSLQLTLVLLFSAAVIVTVTFVQLHRREDQPPAAPDSRQELAKSLLTKLEKVLADAEQTADNPDPVARALREAMLSEWCVAAEMYIRGNPGDVMVRPLLARLRLQMGQASEAERVVDGLLALDSRSAEGLFLKGQIMRLLGKEGHMDFLRRAAEASPSDAEILAAYGRGLIAEGLHEQARGCLEKAIQVRRQAAGQLTANDAGILYDLAVIDMREPGGERLDRASEYLAQAAKLAPSSIDIVLKLIEAQRLAGKLDAAEQTFEDALERFNRWADQAALRMELGRIRSRQQRWLDAAEAFKRAAGHPTLGAEAALEAAKCYYNAGKYAMAMEQIDAALAAVPQDPDVLQWAAKIEDARFPRPQ